MFDRPIALWAAALILGILAGRHTVWLLPVCLILAACSLRKHHPVLAAGILLFFCIGAASAAAAGKPAAPENAFGIKQEASVTGRIRNTVRKQNSTMYTLTDCRLSFDDSRIFPCASVLVYDSSLSGFLPGDQVIFHGTLSRFSRARNPGNFDALQYYRARGCLYPFFADQAVKTAEKADPLRWIVSLRLSIQKSLQENLTAEDYGSASAMLLSDGSAQDQEEKDLFTENGILYLTAVSGLQISILGLGCYRFLRRYRSILFSCVLAAGWLLLYSLLAGFSMTVQRAVWMALFLLLSHALGRTNDLLNSLAAAVLILLMLHPDLLFDSGFLLSVSGILGIGVQELLLPIPMKKAKPTKHGRGRLFGCSGGNSEDKRVPGKKTRVSAASVILSKSVSALFIYLMIVPILMYSYGAVPLCSVFLNLLLLPVMTCLLPLLLAGGLLGAAGISGIAAASVFLPVHGLLCLVRLICRTSRMLPADSVITGAPPAGILFLYYPVLAGAWLLIIREKKNAVRYLLLLVPCLLLFWRQPLPEVQVTMIEMMIVKRIKNNDCNNAPIRKRVHFFCLGCKLNEIAGYAACKLVLRKNSFENKT